MDRSQYTFSGGQGPARRPEPPPESPTLSLALAIGKYLLLALLGFAGWWMQDAIEQNRATLKHLSDTQQGVLRRLESLDRELQAVRATATALQQEVSAFKEVTHDWQQRFQTLGFELRLMDFRYQELRKVMRAYHPGALDAGGP